MFCDKYYYKINIYFGIYTYDIYDIIKHLKDFI